MGKRALWSCFKSFLRGSPAVFLEVHAAEVGRSLWTDLFQCCLAADDLRLGVPRRALRGLRLGGLDEGLDRATSSGRAARKCSLTTCGLTDSLTDGLTALTVSTSTFTSSSSSSYSSSSFL